MVRGYHLILSAYGFWLPNDPRGSWSDAVWAQHLRRFGPATKVQTRRSLAGRPHDAAARQGARRALKYPAVRFNGRQARAVARGVSEIVQTLGLTVHACAVMPDHVHLVIARCGLPIEEVAGHLKRAATRRLNRERLHPLARHADSRGRTPTPWAAGGWFVYLNTPVEIAQRVTYVEANPVKAGLPRQRWGFVTACGPPRGRGG